MVRSRLLRDGEHGFGARALALAPRQGAVNLLFEKRLKLRVTYRPPRERSALQGANRRQFFRPALLRARYIVPVRQPQCRTAGRAAWKKARCWSTPRWAMYTISDPRSVYIFRDRRLKSLRYT